MPRKLVPVLGAPIDVIDWDGAVAQVLAWGRSHAHRYACLCNVHSVVTSTRERAFHTILAHADLATADGAPVAWAVRHIARVRQPRINGPDLMWRCLGAAEQQQLSVFLYGASPATLARLQGAIARHFPRLVLAGAISPPFRPLSEQEDAAMVAAINASGAHLVFVGLGCPKQELWMGAHCGRIDAPLLGVGAAFDYHAGTLARAPLWWQQHGLEWLYRLIQEPRRLAGRYVVGNARFVVGMARQLLAGGARQR